jgi:putative thioredoxin
MTRSPHVIDVDDATFEDEVVARSHQVPVVVDFWAGWCGPCHTLGPLLESAVDARDGQVVLAKVDVDRNPATAQAFRVQGIPQVYGFRDGRPVAQFTGVVPPPQIEAFLDELQPSEADLAVARARTLEPADAERELRHALELDPQHREAAILLAELLVDDRPDEAEKLVAPHRPDPRAEAVTTRAELTRSGDLDLDALAAAAESDDEALLTLGRALAAHGRHDEAIEHLLDAVARGGEVRDPAREQLVALFGLLGDDDPRVTSARPRLARALF